MEREVPTPVPNPLPPWAHPVHVLQTPRLILRSALESDAPAFTKLFSDLKNNPFGGVRGHFKSEDEQRENIIKQAGSTARGENAWLVVILKPSNPTPKNSEVLKVDDGLLIGSTGFNEFKVKKDKEGKEVLWTDVGCLIDWRFHRKGYALETLQAIFEYAFSELKAQTISAETNMENKPWRNLMNLMVS
jgi:RimJ/RimL family protein N-acetyltransferase